MDYGFFRGGGMRFELLRNCLALHSGSFWENEGMLKGSCRDLLVMMWGLFRDTIWDGIGNTYE